MEELLKEFLRTALKYGATDIHFSVDAQGKLEVEMRISGKMYRLPQKAADERFFRFLLYRADMDVSAAALPQTGSFEINVDGKPVALRFALVSGYHLKSGVLRILSSTGSLSVSDLSMNAAQVNYLKSITGHRSGLYLFSGPTGSGKTTTMYTILNETAGRKIYTLEDPVEVYSEKYVQLQVNSQAHLSFAEGIRQLMRHDPDIIMIGEIRDSEAAQMAVRCALTGHLVVTSIHASDCTGAVHRMLDLGVHEYQLSDVLGGITSQRLYDRKDQPGRICVYEVMDREEVTYYFRNHEHSSRFRKLPEAVMEAVENGYISLPQAAPDLA